MTENVFAPPRANLETREGPEALWEMTWKQIRRIYLASINVHALGVLYALGALGLFATAVNAFNDTGPNIANPAPKGLIAFFVTVGLLMIVATVTSYTRPRWARWLGIVLCVLSLINIPLGTIIGIIGILAYVQGGKLFGPERFHHKDVALVYKQRKKDKQ